MQRQKVNSSDIDSIGYDPALCVLEIEFLSGGIYQYSVVPKNIFDGIMSASSHGSYFHQHVKGHFNYKKI